MTFKGTPLFGQDSSPQYTSKILGFAGTVIIWLIIIFCMIVIKPAEKPKKYKEVQIVLETKNTTTPEPEPKEVEKSQLTAEKTAAKTTPVEKKEPKPVEKAITTPAEKTPAKPKPTKTNSAPAKVKNEPVKKSLAPVVEETYEEQWEQEYFDPMEQFAQQTSLAPKKEVNWDEMFQDSTTTETSSLGGKVVGGNSFSGSAGTVAQNSNSNQRKKSVSSSGSSSDWEGEVSSSTSTALGEISNATYVGSSIGGVSSESKVQVTNSGSGKVQIKMSNGRSRVLLKPASPIIILSDKAASLIDGSRSVKIRFMVTKSGNVPESRISITPASILPVLVQTEIKTQIKEWLFESDEYDAFAEFEYNIVKK